MIMAKRIGILGGISHESTARYYSLIHEKYYARRGDYHYPEVVVYSLDFQRFTDYENTDRAAYIGYIMQGVCGLEASGAEFIVMAANSPHSVYDEVSRLAGVPVLSIAEATMIKARGLGLRRLLLLGIKHTMQGTFYQDAGRRHGVQVVTPGEGEQDEVNRIVFDELVIGVRRGESKRRLLEIMDAHPVEGVILGCTELPLILGQGDTELPLLDTVDIHVEAALDHALAGLV
jgi:aspartate racemase